VCLDRLNVIWSKEFAKEMLYLINLLCVAFLLINHISTINDRLWSCTNSKHATISVNQLHLIHRAADGKCYSSVVSWVLNRPLSVFMYVDKSQHKARKGQWSAGRIRPHEMTSIFENVRHVTYVIRLIMKPQCAAIVRQN